MCEIYPKLTIKTTVRCHLRRFNVFIFNFEKILTAGNLTDL